MTRPSWAEHISGRPSYKHEFPGGVPELVGMELQHVVIQREMITIVCRFPTLPHGCNPKWMQLGYREVDLFSEFVQPQLIEFDYGAFLRRTEHVSLEFGPSQFRIVSSDRVLVELRASHIIARFLPDAIAESRLRLTTKSSSIEPYE